MTGNAIPGNCSYKTACASTLLKENDTLLYFLHADSMFQNILLIVVEKMERQCVGKVSCSLDSKLAVSSSQRKWSVNV